MKTSSDANRAVMVQGSASFRASTRLFGARLREDVWALYAWCRFCDDQIDGQALGRDAQPMTKATQIARLEALKLATTHVLRGGEAEEAPFAALQSVARRHQMSSDWPLELLAGFEMDVQQRVYRTKEDLLEYCWGVAGAVGVMMAEIMQARNIDALRRAQDLGIAFQLTNIVRDIVEDARAGRVYLPSQSLGAEGGPATPAHILDGDRSQTFQAATELLDLAEDYYASARRGIRALPFRAALATAAARGVYREIGRRIRRRGPDALDSRMTVPRSVKLWLGARGVLIALWSRFERFTPWPERPALWSRI